MNAETREAHVKALTKLREVIYAEDHAVDLKLIFSLLIDAMLVMLKDSD